MIHRKETSFEIVISLDDEYWDHKSGDYLTDFYVKGTYYYEPNAIYGELPNTISRNDSHLKINTFECIDSEPCDYIELLNDPEFLDEVEELVWKQLLSEDE